MNTNRAQSWWLDSCNRVSGIPGPIQNSNEKIALFGRFTYEDAPTPGNPEKIRILGDWTRKNIVRVKVPQLVKIGGRSGNARVHQAITDQFLGLWKAWDDAGLLNHVKSWHGSFVSRHTRGGKSLSNHSFGSAFDINLTANRLGHVPAFRGEEGSVRELVPIAHKFGFYWGGHFRRRDGMHFEVAKLK